MKTHSDRVARLRAIFGDAAILLPCRAKQPLLSGWQQITLERMSAPKYLAKLQEAAQIGVLCGHASRGLLGLDFDDEGAHGAFFSVLPDTLATVSVKGAKGAKYFFRVEATANLKKSKLYSANGAVGDFLSDGGQAIVDGIHHETGLPYRLEGAAVRETTLERLRELLRLAGISIGKHGPCHADTERRTQDTVFSRNVLCVAPSRVASVHDGERANAIPSRMDAEAITAKRLEALAPPLRKLFTRHVAPYWQPTPHQRNAFLVEAIPMLLRRVAPKRALSLCDAWLAVHREMFQATPEEHRHEAAALIAGVLETYGRDLAPTTRQIYEKLPELGQAAFRICRDLASRTDVPGVFFMSGGELGLRLDTDTQAAFRLLNYLQRIGLLEMLRKGTQRAARVKGEATEWRWMLEIAPAVTAENASVPKPDDAC